MSKRDSKHVDIKKVAIFLWYVFFSVVHVNAELIEVDYLASGDTLLTRDIQSGLEWLDLPETDGISYDTIMAGYGDYTTVGGFRYASLAEVHTLLNHAGLIINSNIWIADTDGRARSLIDKIGYNFTRPTDTLTVGTVEDEQVLQPENNAQASIWLNNDGSIFQYAIIADLNSGTPSSQGNVGTGNWLVRSVAIPEPNSVVCMLVGMGTLWFRRRFRR